MRLLITGASGQLGAYLLAALRDGSDTVIPWSGSRSGALQGQLLRPVDLASPPDVRAAFAEARPDAILHAAALARLGDCQRDPEHARRVNRDGTALLAQLAADRGARLVFVSTDLVFSGENAPYREESPPAPLSEYARTKVEAEAVVQATPGSLIARLSLLYGPSRAGSPGFFDEQIAALHLGRPLVLFSDEWRSPLDLASAARSLLALVHSQVQGILHLGGPQRLSRLEMGHRLAAYLDLPSRCMEARQRADLPGSQLRPRDVSLDSSRWRSLFPALPWPTWEQALRQMGLPGAGSLAASD